MKTRSHGMVADEDTNRAARNGGGGGGEAGRLQPARLGHRLTPWRRRVSILTGYEFEWDETKANVNVLVSRRPVWVNFNHVRRPAWRWYCRNLTTPKGSARPATRHERGQDEDTRSRHGCG